MVRIAVVTAAVTTITVVLIPLQWLSVRFGLPARRAIPVAYHRAICALLGLRVHTVGRPAAVRPLLIVSNHISWLDISVITAVAPVIFVAKREVGTWPVFGLLARLQRSIFVDRNRRHKTGEVNAEIARRLTEGDPVVLFAEGTSSDGNRVLPFRSALIGAAGEVLADGRDARPVVIQPLSIAYTRLQGVPMGRQHRPVAAWYGDLDLLPHLKRVMAGSALDVVVTWGEPMAFDLATDRKTVARSLEATVRRLTIAALRGRRASTMSAMSATLELTAACSRPERPVPTASPPA
jgi:1-acyl-sn-glycerol-3-phosphate acyltransferase